jgi:hypothetical protein
VAAAAVGEWYTRSLALAGDRVAGASSKADELSTRATLLYRIASSDLARSGIFLTTAAADPGPGASRTWVRDGSADLVFDGMAYRGYGDTRFAVQDESGLRGLIPQSIGRTRDFLISRGVDYPKAELLAARLADYVDSDDLVRINGAEAADYRFHGLEPPPNRLLESVYELKGVMGWSELDSLWEDQDLFGEISLRWAGKPSAGTAPRGVLLRMPGATPDLVDGYIAMRHGEGDVGDEVGEWIRELALRDFFAAMPRPSNNLRLRFWRDGERQMREYSVQFTPGGQGNSPWIIEKNYRQPLARDQLSESAKTKTLPGFVL